MYIVSEDRWVAAADTPRPRYRHAAAALDGEVFVMGGRDLSDNIIDAVDAYDVATNSWRSVSGLVDRSDLAAFAWDGAIYAYGGYDASYNALADGVALRPSDGTTWTPPPLTDRRGDFGIAVDVDTETVYAVGGWSDVDWCNPLDSVESLPTSSLNSAAAAATWTSMPPLLVPRGDKAVAAAFGHVFVVGGEHNNACATLSAPRDDVESLDASRPDDGWHVRATLPERRFRFAAAAIGSYLYVFGGQGPHTSDLCESSVDSCFPVTDHAFRLPLQQREDSDNDSSKKKKQNNPSRVGMLLVGLAVGLVAGLCAALCVVRAFVKRLARAHQEKAIMLTDKVLDTNNAPPAENDDDDDTDDRAETKDVGPV